MYLVLALTMFHTLLISLSQNHTPEVMVVDEIGRSTEVSAVATVKARGVRMIASAHGSFKELYQNTQLKGLLGSFTQV
jgi:stage III sporulation protein SpoIIIAA